MFQQHRTSNKLIHLDWVRLLYAGHRYRRVARTMAQLDLLSSCRTRGAAVESNGAPIFELSRHVGSSRLSSPTSAGYFHRAAAAAATWTSVFNAHTSAFGSGMHGRDVELICSSLSRSPILDTHTLSLFRRSAITQVRCDSIATIACRLVILHAIMLAIISASEIVLFYSHQIDSDFSSYVSLYNNTIVILVSCSRC